MMLLIDFYKTSAMGLLQSCISPKSPSVAINVSNHSTTLSQKTLWGLTSSLDPHGGIEVPEKSTCSWPALWLDLNPCLQRKGKEKKCIMKSNKQQCSHTSRQAVNHKVQIISVSALISFWALSFLKKFVILSRGWSGWFICSSEISKVCKNTWFFSLQLLKLTLHEISLPMSCSYMSTCEKFKTTVFKTLLLVVVIPLVGYIQVRSQITSLTSFPMTILQLILVLLKQPESCFGSQLPEVKHWGQSS